MLKKLLFSASILLASMGANAEFSSIDLNAEGDNLVTIDSETGIEWLDFSVTSEDSYQDVLARLQGDLKGWRLPTESEVVSFFDRMMVGYNYISFSGWVSDNNSTGREIRYAANMYRELLGTSIIRKDMEYSIGYFMGDDGEVRLSGVLYDSTNDKPLYYGTTYQGAKLDEELPLIQNNMGVFLVSDGGVSYSSKLNPEINENNQNARYNDVPFWGGLALLIPGIMFSLRRRV